MCVPKNPFALRFGITERVSNSQVAGFVRHLGSGVMKLAGNEIEDIIPNPLIGSVVKLPLQYLSKAITDSLFMGLLLSWLATALPVSGILYPVKFGTVYPYPSQIDKFIGKNSSDILPR